ncbi:MAG: 30S ribosomal protein S4, partial [Planctomycetota bacterium]
LSRKLLAETSDERVVVEKQILGRLTHLKIVPENSNLNAILDLTVENILERRLQTLVYRRGFSKSPQQARQLITHGHILIQGQRVTSPSYLVKTEEEQKITCSIPISPSE